MQGAYLDHAASSPPRPEALAAFVEAAAVTGNPAALHRPGQRSRALLEEAREELAEAVGAQPSEVIFTSGGSEADTLAVLGSWDARRGRRDRCLVSAIEHPAVLSATRQGAQTIPVRPDGKVDLDALECLVDERVALVSVMSLNNETGIIQPVDEVRRIAGRVGARLHCDAVQALGRIQTRFEESGCDLMSLSGHKVGAPAGIGALLARRDTPLRAVGLGGGQERQVRSGTVPVALAVAFARAARIAVANLTAEGTRLAGLRDHIAQAAVSAGARLNSQADGAPHIVNATFPGVRADDLLVVLDERGIHASVGSACRAGVHRPSEVLIAMGRGEGAAQSIRFSLGWSSTEAEVSLVCAQLPAAVELARAASGA